MVEHVFPKLSEIHFPGLRTLRIPTWTTYFVFFLCVDICVRSMFDKTITVFGVCWPLKAAFCRIFQANLGVACSTKATTVAEWRLQLDLERKGGRSCAFARDVAEAK